MKRLPLLPSRPHLVRTMLLLTLLASSWTLHASMIDARASVSVGGDTFVTKGAARNLREDRSAIPREEPDFSQAIAERQELLGRSLRVEFSGRGEGEFGIVGTWDITLGEHPLWVVFDTELFGRPTAVVSEKRIEQHIKNDAPFSFAEPRSCTLLSEWTDEHGVLRGQTECVAQDGYTFDARRLSQMIRAALEQGKSSLTFPLTFVPGTVTGAAGSLLDGEELSLLSVGHTNFKGSGLGRKSNVRKGLHERVHNVIVPPDAEFSFNQTLGPVTLSRGWHNALTIFEGVNLRPAPGGGICQVSTTTYRAALRAGLPILKQKSHSLYVTYYEAYGVGLDATIFPGKQDMVFKNDTGAPILIQAYSDGDEAYVKFYGKDDGRTVVMDGPYFASTAPEGKTIRYNEILWNRTVTLPGAAPVSEEIVARYNKGMPKALPSRWTAEAEQTRGDMPMHAAAVSVLER